MCLCEGNLVNKEEWLGRPANIKGANKDGKMYVGRSTTVQNLLFCAHTLCMSYVTNTFLLVSSSVRSKQLLCFVQGQGQKREQKHTTKNFVGFHNLSPLLTIVQSTDVDRRRRSGPFVYSAPPKSVDREGLGGSLRQQGKGPSFFP